MKKLIICILIMITVSCNDSDVEVIKNNRIYNLDIIEIEGCQYLIGNDKMTHKGNCKNKIHRECLN